jgi:uncharacterized membrane protein
MRQALLITFIVLFPAFTLFVKEKIPLAAKWSPLIACYIAGLVLGNLGILPANSGTLLDSISTAAVALSIPLLLFSVDIKNWKTLSGKAILAFGLAAFSIAIVSTIMHLTYGRNIQDSAKVAGMLVGLYTGGTPNLAAIKTALDVDMNVYLAVHTSDMVVSAIYLLVVMTVAKPFFSKFMPVKDWTTKSYAGDDSNRSVRIKDYFKKAVAPRILIGIGLAIGIVAISLGLSTLFSAEYQTMVVILLISSLAILASRFPAIRAIPYTFNAGEYILYVFCIAVGAMGNLSLIVSKAPTYFIYVTVALTGSFLLHALLCAIFKIDVDTMLIVSTSSICSPPFVGVVAVSLNARRLIVPGITTGIIGYALGNYLGIVIGVLLRTL